MGLWATLYTIPFRKFHFQLVLLIPYSAIAKTILFRSLIFHIFARVEKQPLKQQLKHKRCIILKDFLSVSFNYVSELEIFYHLSGNPRNN